MLPRHVLVSLIACITFLRGQTIHGEPSAVGGAKPPEATQPVRTDHYGDPLPKGVRFRLGTARLRHEGIVNTLAWMPDGKTLAAATYDDPARLWRIADGKELRRINGGGAIQGLAVTRDGRLLAWGDPGVGVHISDPKTGKEVHLLKKAAQLSMAGTLGL